MWIPRYFLPTFRKAPRTDLYSKVLAVRNVNVLRGEEKHPAVRAILGHFLFGFIHPYNDGNGRMSRFVMNTMLSTGGYTWTIIPVGQRNGYMKALEKASIEEDITDFTKLIADLMG